jgi:hypothetical protein
MTKLVVTDHPDGRWASNIFVDKPGGTDALIRWLDDNIPEQCDLAYRYNSGDPYWHITGGQHQRDVLTVLILTWG